MNSRRITSSWNNQRNLEYFEEEGPSRGRAREHWMTSRTNFPSVDASRSRRVQAETMVGKAIELEREEGFSSDDDNECGGKLSFRDKRLLLARKRIDATAVSANQVTLGAGNYATQEYHIPTTANARSVSAPRVRVLPQNNDFEVALENASIQREPLQQQQQQQRPADAVAAAAPPQQRLRARSSSVRRSSSETLSPVSDDVSSLGSTGSDAYSSKSWLPPKLQSTPSNNKTQARRLRMPERKNPQTHGSSPESYDDDAHPPKYVAALNRSNDATKQTKTDVSSRTTSVVETQTDKMPPSTENTKAQSDFMSFQIAQKAKSLRKSRLHASASLTTNSQNPVEDKALFAQQAHHHPCAASHSHSTTATVTTSSTTLSSLPSSSLRKSIPLTTHLDSEDDDRSIKSSITNYTTRTDMSGPIERVTHVEQAKAQRIRRRKIALMYHVLTCTHPPPSLAVTPEEYVPCPKLKCCYALSILIRHAQTCNFVPKDGVEQCDVPSCADYKKAWLHFRRCALARSAPSNLRPTCILCSDFPIEFHNNVIPASASCDIKSQ